MFTKNFQRIMAYIFNPQSYGFVTGKSVDGTTLYASMSNYSMAQGKEPTNMGSYILQTEGDPASANNGWSLLLGTGDTPPTKDDLKLAAQATTLKALTRSCISNLDRNGLSTSAVITNTFANYTEEPITVKEMGLYYVLSAPFSGNKTGIMLAAREVLPEPIIMKPGDVRTFQMTLDFSNI